MKYYSILYSSFDIWIYCCRNDIDITRVPEEQYMFIKLKFPDVTLTGITVEDDLPN